MSTVVNHDPEPVTSLQNPLHNAHPRSPNRIAWSYFPHCLATPGRGSIRRWPQIRRYIGLRVLIGRLRFIHYSHLLCGPVANDDLYYGCTALPRESTDWNVTAEGPWHPLPFFQPR